MFTTNQKKGSKEEKIRPLWTESATKKMQAVTL